MSEALPEVGREAGHATGHADIGQQLGRIQGQLGALTGLVQERKRDADKHHDETQAELRTVKHDQRNLEQKVESVAWKVDRVEGMAQQTARTVADLKKPVDELVALRSKALGVLLVLGSLGGVAGWFTEPIRRWVGQHFTP